MRARKTRQTPGAARFLLSLNQKLRTLSLRRISERMNTAKRRSRTKAGAKPRGASSRSAARRAGGMDSRAIVFASVCVVAAAALIAARPSTNPAEGSADRHEVSSSKQGAGAAEPTPAPSRPPAAPRATRLSTTVSPGAAEPVEASVTLTGCVEEDDGAYRLKDVSGEDAPKSRSWKSGFLTRRSSSVELVGGPGLSNYVGQRVAVTGTLVDREMHARSLRRVASACD